MHRLTKPILPEVFVPKSLKFRHRVLATAGNIACLPFFAAGALLVLAIALLMRFGGRSS